MGVEVWPLHDPATAFLKMTSGAGAAPMHAAGAALHSLGGSVEGMVATSVANATALAANWSGQGNLASSVTGAAMAGEDSHYALLSVVRGQLLNAAGELYTTIPPTMVTHIQANANRGEWGIDNAINPWVLGMLTPRLIDLDTEYFGFMWPNNASAGLRYGAGLDALGAALAGLSALPAIAGGSVAAPAMAAADVASNAGMSMMSVVMSATEQAATSALSPASGAAQGAQAGSLTGQSQLSPSNTSSSTSGISPLANVTSHAPVSPSLAQSQPPAMGMFAPPAAAALTPSAPSPAMPSSPPVQAMTPSAAPGVTSFAKPAEPFSPPPPSGGKAVGLKPGMLNASALRGPVGTAPASTALLTKPLTTASSLATQPLAHVTPDVPRPVSSTPPPHPLLSDPGSIQTLNPPPQPQQIPPQPSPPQPPSPGTGSQPGPSTGSGGSQGTGGPGTQMPGSGQGGAPSAPLPAVPLDTRPPPIPPRPSPGEPPLRPPSPPSWASPQVPQSVQAAQDELKDLETRIQQHNANPPDSSNYGAVAAYNAEADYYNACAAQLRGVLDGAQVQYTPATTAKTAEIPSWTQPAPPSTQPKAPGSQQPTAPIGPSLQQQAKQIGEEVRAVQKGSGQLDALAGKVNGLHLDQEQAAEAAEIAAQTAFGDTSGIASLPNGMKVVLPLRIDQGVALMVDPNGVVSVFKGDLYQFLPYL